MGLGAALDGGVVDGVTIVIVGGFGAGDGGRQVCGGGGGAGGVDVEEFPRPEIKCRQYLPSREKCAHVLSAPVFPTPGMTRRRL